MSALATAATEAGYRTSVDPMKAQVDKLQRELRNAVKSMRTGARPGTDDVGKKGPKDKRRKTNEWCEYFNTPSGCGHVVQNGECTRPDGTKKKHGCNHVINGQKCNSVDHNRNHHL